MAVSAVGASAAYAFSPYSSSPNKAAGTAGGAVLSDADLRLVAQLQQRDRVVRAHEMAHVAAGAGLLTRGASYTYQTGPDGQRYAIGGEVGIDVSPGRTPEETLAKAEGVRAAALAPADPSAQDRQVAARAERMAMDARLEIFAGTASRSGATGDRVAASYGAAGRSSDSAGTGAQVDTYA